MKKFWEIKKEKRKKKTFQKNNEKKKKKKKKKIKARVNDSTNYTKSQQNQDESLIFLPKSSREVF